MRYDALVMPSGPHWNLYASAKPLIASGAIVLSIGVLKIQLDARSSRSGGTHPTLTTIPPTAVRAGTFELF